jgi:hypothetical protein
MADRELVAEKKTSALHTSTLSSSTLAASVSSLTKEDVTQKTDLEAQSESKRTKGYAFVRYTLLDIYRRLFSLVFFANLAVFIAVIVTDRSLLSFVNAAAANLVVCGLARQPLIVNAIFLTVCSIPRSAPLRLRRIAAKAYHYGGVHSGCGIAAFVWYVGLVALASQQYWFPGDTDPIILSTAVVVLSYIILVLLLAIIVVAYPAFRFRRHDYFELTHRFSGWLVVALFLALLILFANDARRAQGLSLGRYVIQLPAFWFLMVTIVAIVHPWLLLRRVRVQPEVLSRHAVRLHFDHTTTAFGKGIQLSKHPLQDWHGFATFPNPDGKSFSCLVSKAGDWTADCIQNPPTHLWKRGVLIYGFAYAMRVFRKVIVVTTGSGIGPCLSFLGDEHRPSLRVVWQTRAPLQTYGQAVIDLVKRMDPKPLVIDTNECGRVNMLPIIQRLVDDFEAEAVCVISNPVLTKKLVFGLEERGVPAFGPIFDS